MVGVEINPKDETLFVVYCYTKSSKNNYEIQETHIFRSRNAMQSHQWAAAIRSKLRGFDIGGEFPRFPLTHSETSSSSPGCVSQSHGRFGIGLGDLEEDRRTVRDSPGEC